MQRRNILQWGAAALAVAASLGTAQAQSFPAKPIKLVIAFPAGGPTDITMRALADNASKILGQPVIVENKPGAGGTLPAQALQTAQPDGYTLAQIPLGVFRLPYTTKINWDPVKDISYVLNVTGYAFGLVVPADSPLKTWTHFVAWAKANPGKLSYGSTGTMTSPHLTMELIAQQLGLELLHVPYKGSADLMQSILGGQIMAAADSTGFAPQVEAGKLRVLNTWGAERLAKFPDAPTLKELGLNLVQNSPFGIGAPKGTPDAVVKRLHDAFKQAMEQESYKTALARYGLARKVCSCISRRRRRCISGPLMRVMRSPSCRCPFSWRTLHTSSSNGPIDSEGVSSRATAQWSPGPTGRVVPSGNAMPRPPSLRSITRHTRDFPSVSGRTSEIRREPGRQTRRQARACAEMAMSLSHAA